MQFFSAPSMNSTECHLQHQSIIIQPKIPPHKRPVHQSNPMESQLVSTFQFHFSMTCTLPGHKRRGSPFRAESCGECVLQTLTHHNFSLPCPISTLPPPTPSLQQASMTPHHPNLVQKFWSLDNFQDLFQPIERTQHVFASCVERVDRGRVGHFGHLHGRARRGLRFIFGARSYPGATSELLSLGRSGEKEWREKV